MNRLRVLPHFVFAALLVMLALSLQACSSMGLEKPRSIEDNLRYAQSGVSAAYKTIGDLKSTNQINAAQGRIYFDKAERVESQLGVADKALSAGDKTKAQNQVDLALTGLKALQSELKARQPSIK